MRYDDLDQLPICFCLSFLLLFFSFLKHMFCSLWFDTHEKTKFFRLRLMLLYFESFSNKLPYFRIMFYVVGFFSPFVVVVCHSIQLTIISIWMVCLFGLVGFCKCKWCACLMKIRWPFQFSDIVSILLDIACVFLLVKWYFFSSECCCLGGFLYHSFSFIAVNIKRVLFVAPKTRFYRNV